MIDDIKYTFFGILIAAIVFITAILFVYLSETENKRIANIRHWISNIAVGIIAFGVLLTFLYFMHELGKYLYTKIF